MPDSGHIGYRPRVGLGVQPLGVSLDTDIDGRVDEHFDEVAVVEEIPRCAPVGLERRHQRDYDDQTGIQHELGCLGDPADIFRAVLEGESEILIEPDTNVVTVKHISMQTHGMQMALQAIRDR